MTVEYDQLIPEIKDLTDSVNRTMKGFGFDEEMHLRGKAVNIEITAERKLKPTEKRKIAEHALAVFSEKLPQYKWMTEKMEYEGATDEESDTEHTGSHEELPF